jgi:hypothetical protein
MAVSGLSAFGVAGLRRIRRKPAEATA